MDLVLDTALAGLLGMATERICRREVQPAGLSVFATAAARIRRLGARAPVGALMPTIVPATDHEPVVAQNSIWRN